jgi:hypothetical protein
MKDIIIMNACLALTLTRHAPAPAVDQSDESDTTSLIVFVPTGTPRLVHPERVDFQKHTHVNFIHVGTLFIRAHVVRSERRFETPGTNSTCSTELTLLRVQLMSTRRASRWHQSYGEISSDGGAEPARPTMR